MALGTKLRKPNFRVSLGGLLVDRCFQLNHKCTFIGPSPRLSVVSSSQRSTQRKAPKFSIDHNGQMVFEWSASPNAFDSITNWYCGIVSQLKERAPLP